MKAPHIVLEREDIRVVRPPAEMEEKPEESKWGGLYLRAPDIFYCILEKAGDRLVPLKEVAEVRRGFTTGANDFFYLEPLPYRPVCPLCGVVHEDALTADEEQAYRARGEQPPAGKLVAVRNGMGWEGYLEDATLKTVFKSPKEASSLTVGVGGLNRVFFPASREMDKLPRHAKSYVRWGERAEIRQKKGSNKGAATLLPQLSTLQGRSPWWWLGEWPVAQVVLPMFEGARKYAFWNPAGAMIDNAMYLVLPRKGVAPRPLALALNTTLFGFFKELMARPPEGLGALQMKVYDYEAMPVPAPSLLNDLKNADWAEGFLSRPILPFWEEVGLDPRNLEGVPHPQLDRARLDQTVFKALGLTDEQSLKIYRTTVQLVWERISKAESLDQEA